MKEEVLQHMTDREERERETTQVQDCGPFHSAALSFDTHVEDLIKTPVREIISPPKKSRAPSEGYLSWVLSVRSALCV